MHLHRKERHGDFNWQSPTVIERFMKFVKEEGSCWIWTGQIDKDGYGCFNWEKQQREQGKNSISHRAIRFSYEFFIEPIPDGIPLDHLCRNRACVNPNDLEPVTTKENIKRGNTGINNAQKTHCPYGHEYTKENTRIVKKDGSRICKYCHRERERNRHKLTIQI